MSTETKTPLERAIEEVNERKLGVKLLERLFSDIVDQIDILDPSEEDQIVMNLLAQAASAKTDMTTTITIFEYLLGVESLVDYLEEFLNEHRSIEQ